MTTEPDAGLQAERTAMAWQRTALGIGGVSALLLHRAGGDGLATAPGAAGLVAAVAVLLGVEARYLRTHRHVEAGTSPMGRTAVRAVAATTVLLALGALVVVTWGPPRQ